MRRRRLALACAAALVALAVDWLFVMTHRLYLEQRVPFSSGSAAARQRFQVGSDRVTHEILHENGTIAFPWRAWRPYDLRFNGQPSKGSATYQVRRGGNEVLASGRLTGATEVTVRIPPGHRTVELSNQGAMTWSEPRLVRVFPYPPVPAVAALLAALAAGRPRRRPGGRSREVLFRWVTAAVGAAGAIAVLEVGLRAMGDRVPEFILEVRRTLGEVRPDPRWRDDPRYGSRLGANLDTFAEWQQGDIVRMGFIPPREQAERHRFPFFTDAEGFRNRTVRHPIHVAALGDSFTDAMTLPLEEVWTSRLEARLGKAVQNYGTAAFGPQQELYALEDYALKRRPSVVVVAFFAGNDLFNAETFAGFEASGGRNRPPRPAWRIKDVEARFDRFYVMSLLTGLKRALVHWAERAPARAISAALPGGSEYGGPPSFREGRFMVRADGRWLRFALMPPYLQVLTSSSADLEARRGWALTREALRRMKRLCEAAGARLVVLFVPFKSQVYLPLLMRSFPERELERHLASYFREDPIEIGVPALAANRLALNQLMRRFCAEAGLELLDLTPALEAELLRGHDVYLPDDSHWSAPGHEVAARELARLLTATAPEGQGTGGYTGFSFK